MIAGQVFIKNIVDSSVPNHTKEKRTRIFVPVSFSEASYNALAYALKLAKVLNGTIDLFHVVDVAGVPVSDSPLVVNRWLQRQEKEAAGRMQSLREIISESHVDVSSSISLPGNVQSCLLKQIKELLPDLIVISKGSGADNVAPVIAESLSCPVLIVPPSVEPVIPVKMVLATDRKSVPESDLLPFFKIVQQSTKSFTVLSGLPVKPGHVREAPDIYLNGFSFQVTYLQNESVLRYVDLNVVDLLCLVRRKRTLYERLFQKDRLREAINKLTVPILIVGRSVR